MARRSRAGLGTARQGAARHGLFLLRIFLYQYIVAGLGGAWPALARQGKARFIVLWLFFLY